MFGICTGYNMKKFLRTQGPTGNNTFEISPEGSQKPETAAGEMALLPSKVLALQTEGPRFNPQNPCKKLD